MIAESTEQQQQQQQQPNKHNEAVVNDIPVPPRLPPKLPPKPQLPGNSSGTNSPPPILPRSASPKYDSESPVTYRKPPRPPPIDLPRRELSSPILLSPHDANKLQDENMPPIIPPRPQSPLVTNDITFVPPIPPPPTRGESPPMVPPPVPRGVSTQMGPPPVTRAVSTQMGPPPLIPRVSNVQSISDNRVIDGNTRPPPLIPPKLSSSTPPSRVPLPIIPNRQRVSSEPTDTPTPPPPIPPKLR